MIFNKLVPFLDTMSTTQIDRLDIDLRQDTITLTLKPQNMELSDAIEITFEEVTTFYYLDENRQPQPYLGNPAKIDAIAYYSEGFGQFAAIEVVNGVERGPFVVSHPNFIVTMLDRSLMIEAKSVKINGQTFRVGYPKN